MRGSLPHDSQQTFITGKRHTLPGRIRMAHWPMTINPGNQHGTSKRQRCPPRLEKLHHCFDAKFKLFGRQKFFWQEKGAEKEIEQHATSKEKKTVNN
jgi:hypothetical protein